MKKQTPATNYPIGYFTADLWPNKPWPYVGWVARDWKESDGRLAANTSARASKKRDKAAALGVGWGRGTIHGIGKATAHRTPQMMVRKK